MKQYELPTSLDELMQLKMMLGFTSIIDIFIIPTIAKHFRVALFRYTGWPHYISENIHWLRDLEISDFSADQYSVSFKLDGARFYTSYPASFKMLVDAFTPELNKPLG